MSGLATPHTLVSEDDTLSGAAVPLVIGLILGLVAVALGAGAVMAEPGLWIGVGVTGLIALILLALGIGEVRKLRRLDPGVLDLPAPFFHLSSTTTGRFRRRVKRGSRTPTEVTAELVLREWVRYTVGTDTRTATHDVSTTPVSIVPVADVDGIAGDVTLHLPAYPPTFEAHNNKVRWLLVVHITFADGFSEDSVIPLPVAPAILVDGRG